MASPPPDLPFYGAEQAAIHHRDFGDLARSAARRLIAELHAVGVSGGTVVDLGCGSGILARIVAEAGYDVVGYDISPAMVDLARATAPAATFEVASLHDVELRDAVAVTAIGEALNYATDPRAGLGALRTLFSRVAAALHPDGVLLGDVAMPGRNGPGGVRIQIHDQPDWTLHMRAEETATTLHRAIAIFRRTGEATYRRVDEHHVLRLYTADDLDEAAAAAGLTIELEPRYTPDPSSSTPSDGWTVFAARPAG